MATQGSVMTIDKYDMLLDAINQVRRGIDGVARSQGKQFELYNERFDRLEKTIYGNGMPGLKGKVYWLIAIVGVLASYHGLNVFGVLGR